MNDLQTMKPKMKGKKILVPVTLAYTNWPYKFVQVTKHDDILRMSKKKDVAAKRKKM